MNHEVDMNLKIHHKLPLLFSREVTTAQYNEFYKYIANAYDVPMHTLHFRADAPIDLKVLLYVPSFHSEKFGMGRIEAGKWREVCLSFHQEMCMNLIDFIMFLRNDLCIML